jgi:hypothetical protein
MDTIISYKAEILTYNFIFEPYQFLQIRKFRPKRIHRIDSRKILEDAGAHFVIDTVNELPDIIEEINRRMEIGVGP